ncbi:MAG: c-type cytochrome [Burkholderiaceae bacterium]
MKNPLRLLIALAALSLAGHAFAQDARPGDVKAGESKAAMCIGCHGIPAYKSSFPEIYHVPKIAGQNAKYIVAALTEYKKGERRHPTMRSIAVSLNEQDMADLAAFYSQEYSADAPPVAVAPAAVAELLKKGNCASCHGDNFSKPIDASYPKLAGQHADYLYFALKAYQVDNNPRVGRGNAIMKGMAKPFSHAELKQIADYIGALPGELATVPQSRFR